jgi:small subunit ribosomal protein S18
MGRPFFRRRKSCPFSGPNAPVIDYKDVRLLQGFVSERGKIVPSRISASWRRRSSAPATSACCRSS